MWRTRGRTVCSDDNLPMPSCTNVRGSPSRLRPGRARASGAPAAHPEPHFSSLARTFAPARSTREEALHYGATAATTGIAGDPMSPSRPDHHGRKDSRSRQPHARAATPRGGTPRANQNARRGRPQPKVLLALALVAAVVVVLALAVRGCATDNASGQAEADAQQATDDQVARSPWMA